MSQNTYEPSSPAPRSTIVDATRLLPNRTDGFLDQAATIASGGTQMCILCIAGDQQRAISSRLQSFPHVQVFAASYASALPMVESLIAQLAAVGLLPISIYSFSHSVLNEFQARSIREPRIYARVANLGELAPPCWPAGSTGASASLDGRARQNYHPVDSVVYSTHELDGWVTTLIKALKSRTGGAPGVGVRASDLKSPMETLDDTVPKGSGQRNGHPRFMRAVVEHGISTGRIRVDEGDPYRLVNPMVYLMTPSDDAGTAGPSADLPRRPSPEPKGPASYVPTSAPAGATFPVLRVPGPAIPAVTIPTDHARDARFAPPPGAPVLDQFRLTSLPAPLDVQPDTQSVSPNAGEGRADVTSAQWHRVQARSEAAPSRAAHAKGPSADRRSKGCIRRIQRLTVAGYGPFPKAFETILDAITNRVSSSASLQSAEVDATIRAAIESAWIPDWSEYGSASHLSAAFIAMLEREQIVRGPTPNFGAGWRARLLRARILIAIGDGTVSEKSASSYLTEVLYLWVGCSYKERQSIMSRYQQTVRSAVAYLLTHGELERCEHNGSDHIRRARTSA